MTHLSATLRHLDVAAGHLRIAVDDDEATPVDGVLCDALLMGWRRDRATLLSIITEEIP